MHWLDRLSLRWLKRQHVFEGGWGELDGLIPHGEKLKVPHAAPTLKFEWSAPKRERSLTVQDGLAPSPSEVLPNALKTVRVRRILTPRPARTRLIFPPSWGDGGYGARMWLVGALVARNIEPWLLEGAYLGERAAQLKTVEDFFRMGLSHIEEVRALAQTHHAEGARTAVAGFSMAGQLGSMAVQSLAFELPVIAMSASPSPDVVFIDGPLSMQVQWPHLGDDAKERLRTAMRHVSVLDQPRPTSARRAMVITEQDGIVAPAAQERIAAHWDVEPTKLRTGHLGAYVFERRRLQQVIADTLLG